MRRLFISLMLTLTAFIVNAQPSAIAPRDYQLMLKNNSSLKFEIMAKQLYVASQRVL